RAGLSPRVPLLALLLAGDHRRGRVGLPSDPVITDVGSAMTQELMLDPTDPTDADGPYGPDVPHLVRDGAPEPGRDLPVASARQPGRDLGIVSERPRVDLAAAERAAAQFLTALGVDLRGDGLSQTPARMARAYAELFDARPFRLTTFPNEEGYDELVLARDMPFRTVCEHHLLPFSGVAHVGYLPGDALLCLST